MTTQKRDDTPKGDEVIALVRRGLQALEEAFAERDALRARVNAFERDPSSGRSGGASADEVGALRRQVAELEEQRRQASQRAAQAEANAREHQTRAAEIEEEHNNLANLYIASHQLHSAMRFRDVVLVVSEIVINLVGVSRFALFMLDVPTQNLHAITTEGHAQLPAPISVGKGVVGRAAARRERHQGTAADPPLLALPLTDSDRLMAVLVIEELFVQKEGFSPVDQELFTLLTSHAGPALLSAFLREHHGEGALDAALTAENFQRCFSG